MGTSVFTENINKSSKYMQKEIFVSYITIYIILISNCCAYRARWVSHLYVDTEITQTQRHTTQICYRFILHSPAFISRAPLSTAA